jgi:molybdopterin-guanine dinucleotide biosynthesis protein B
MERLIHVLTQRGYRVGTIKHHAHPGFEVDKPGKDTWRHAQAGARAVALVSPGKMFLVRHTDGEMPLEEVRKMLGEVDIAVTEGYRWASTPKIEVLSGEDGPLSSNDQLIAVVCGTNIKTESPVFAPDDAEGLADLLEKKFLPAVS